MGEWANCSRRFTDSPIPSLSHSPFTIHHYSDKNQKSIKMPADGKNGNNFST
jgi:hypothetical protein